VILLQAHDVSKWFDSEMTRLNILKNVNLTVNLGEILYIVGPSGSGKTTLLSIISGILKPNEGTVIFREKDIWHMSDDELADVRLNSIGFVFQDFHLFPKLTATENVAIPLLLQRKKLSQALLQAEETLTRVGLSHRLHTAPNKLSVGEQQRVAIARAIVTQPELLLFDEPTASLDAKAGSHMISFVKESLLDADHAIIIVTHDHRIYHFATRILQLENGHLEASNEH